MLLGTLYNIETIAPLLERVYHFQWRGKQMETMQTGQGNKSCEVLKIKHHLPVYHLISSGTWWNCLPVFFQQNSGQSLSLIHSVTAALKIPINALAEKAARHHCNAGQAHEHFSFLPGEQAMLIPPRTQNPATCEEADTAGKRKLPSHCPSQWGFPVSTEVGNNMSPPIAAHCNIWRAWSATHWATSCTYRPFSLHPTASLHSS